MLAGVSRVVVRSSAACRAGVTRSAGRRSPTTATSAGGVSSPWRPRRRSADRRGVRASGPGTWSTSFAGSTSSVSRSSPRARLRLLVLRGEADAGSRAPLLPPVRRWRDWSPVGRDARLPAPRRGCAPAAFTAFLYGDLSPFAKATRFGQAFVVMELGFAVVAALVFLAWLTDRRWLLWLGLCALARARLRAPRSRATSPTTAERLPFIRRLGASCPRLRSGTGGLLSLGLVSGTTRGSAGRTWRFSEIRRAAGRARRRGRGLHDVQALPRDRRFLVGRLRAAAARQARARLPRAFVGRVPHFIVRPRLEQPLVARSLFADELAGEATGRGRDPAARGDPGRLEAACEAGSLRPHRPLAVRR